MEMEEATKTFLTETTKEAEDTRTLTPIEALMESRNTPQGDGTAEQGALHRDHNRPHPHSSHLSLRPEALGQRVHLAKQGT